MVTRSRREHEDAVLDVRAMRTREDESPHHAVPNRHRHGERGPPDIGKIRAHDGVGRRA
jgi:hypothetical protein